MKTGLHKKATAFWMKILEKLNKEDENIHGVAEVVEDLCAFFEFQQGFIYYSDHKSVFYLDQYFGAESGSGLCPEKIDLQKMLNQDMIELLKEEKMIAVTEGSEKSALEEALMAIFQAGSLILLPILGDGREIVAFTGIVDQRGKDPGLRSKKPFVYSVFAVIANHIKLQLYRHRIERTKQVLSSIADNMGVDIYVNDFYTHEILYVNKSMAEPYGGVEAMEGKVCWQVLYEDKTAQCEYCPQFKLIDEEGNPTKIYSWNYQRPFDGAWFRVLSAAFEWTDGRTAHIVSSIDITEDKENEAVIRKMAEYDTLTTLPNRRKLEQDCSTASNADLAGKFVLFFDLNGFKQVNDLYGHRAGDELLRKIGVFLQNQKWERVTAYRYGGDEFVLLCSQYTVEAMIKLANHILTRFKRGWKLSDREVKCGASIGIAGFPDDGADTRALLRSADQAMYVSKSEVRDKIHFYNSGNICTAAALLERRSADNAG